MLIVLGQSSQVWGVGLALPLSGGHEQLELIHLGFLELMPPIHCSGMLGGVYVAYCL